MSDISDPENKRTLGFDAFTFSRLERFFYYINQRPDKKEKFLQQMQESVQETEKKTVEQKANSGLTQIMLALIGVFIINTSVNASDIFIGRRGPTSWQIDQRVEISETEKGSTTSGRTMLKYCTGDKNGSWFMINTPYQKGLGDTSIYIGPRGRTDDFHWFAYAGATLPTGPETRTQRTDINIGGFFTQMSKDQKSEIDCSLEYKLTGVNRSGINPPDEFSGGLLYGRQLGKTNRWRIASGITYNSRENGDYSLNSRTVVRYTVSKNLHFEAMYTFPMQTNILRTTNFGLFMRLNI